MDGDSASLQTVRTLGNTSLKDKALVKVGSLDTAGKQDIGELDDNDLATLLAVDGTMRKLVTKRLKAAMVSV